MGVRPPSDDADDSPDVIEFGIAALDARLDDVDVEFPATTEEVRRAVGRERIPYDASGNAMSFDDVLDEVGKREFDTEQDLLNAAHPVFERKRESMSGSLLGQLRRLVPF